MTGIALNMNAFGNIWMPVMLSPLLSFLPQIVRRQTSFEVLHFFFRGTEMRGDEPDGGGRLEDVEVLQDVWNCHQTEGSQEPESCIEKLPIINTAHRIKFLSLIYNSVNSCF